MKAFYKSESWVWTGIGLAIIIASLIDTKFWPLFGLGLVLFGGGAVSFFVFLIFGEYTLREKKQTMRRQRA